MFRVILSVTLSTVTASILAGLVCYVGFEAYRGQRGFYPKQDITRDFLERLSRDILEYKTVNQSFPESLAKVPPPSRYGGSRPRVDEWGEPVHYLVETDGDFLLWSLGRNRKTGGEGMNCDIYSDDREGKLRRVTWMQFVSECSGRPKKET